MTRTSGIAICLLAAWMAPAIVLSGADSAPSNQEPAAAGSSRSGIEGKLVATVGKSLIIDSPLKIDKISVANGELVEAIAINPQEVLINGKAAGETPLIVWQHGGRRLVYDLTVRVSPVRLEAVRQQIARDFPNDDINITFDNDTVFVRGAAEETSGSSTCSSANLPPESSVPASGYSPLKQASQCIDRSPCTAS